VCHPTHRPLQENSALLTINRLKKRNSQSSNEHTSFTSFLLKTSGHLEECKPPQRPLGQANQPVSKPVYLNESNLMIHQACMKIPGTFKKDTQRVDSSDSLLNYQFKNGLFPGLAPSTPQQQYLTSKMVSARNIAGSDFIAMQ